MSAPHDPSRLLALLPQKGVALLLDRLESVEPGVSAIGWRTFSPGDRVFEGHLPGEPLVPGVAVIEALAQLSGCALVPAGFGQPISGYLAEVSRLRFRRLVRPGEPIRLSSRLRLRLGSAARFEVEARVGEEVVAEGELTVGGMR